MDKLEKLLFACKNGNIDEVSKLIKSSFFSKGADVNGIGIEGYSPLLWALKNNNHELQSLLVSNGADLNACDNKKEMSPLQNAVELGNIELIDILLSNGADINKKTRRRPPISFAISDDKLEIAKFLISKGADVNTILGKGYPILSWSIFTGAKKIINLLVSEGADVNMKNNDGDTPILIALNKISDTLGRSTTGFFGEIAVQICIDTIEVIKYLISKGADLSIENDKGESPYSKTQQLQSSYPTFQELKTVFTNSEMTIKKAENINSVSVDFKNAKGGADLAKLIRTHSAEDIESFCKNYQFEDIKLNDGLSTDVNRFEGITILAEIIMDHERVRKEDPSAKLPIDFPYNQVKDVLIKRIVNFLKGQANINIAPINRTRIYEFSMTLIRIKDYHSAIECLKISKPSLKGDDEFWIAACYFNIANSGNDKNNINEAISIISKLIKSKPNFPNQTLETLDKMYNILIEK